MPSIVACAKTTTPRDRVRDVAAGLFADRGLDGFKMRDLAQRLGVSVMTPYRYFENKEAILACVRAHGFACLADALDQARDGGTLEERVARLVTAYGAFATAEPARYRLMFTLAPARVPGVAEVRRQERRVEDAFAAHVAGFAAVGPTCADPVILGRLLWSTLHGVAVLHLGGQLPQADLTGALYQAAWALVTAWAGPAVIEPAGATPAGTAA
ncbi:TetR/AcrR family transcriptional regulator [Nitrospirillum amazonense]|uniref:TetR family transcriptional regulator n=1 Tax=Nitrospirillum amazonense TaxID=28077 RepID=A0A560J8V3_9PROT|nr:TetR/AcrR family transcriptional regulator [Nitrospirillum amazonense]MDG3439528.1 TetR/AcrR family transcriptional regulator [Nitrospirillum amazonense]TWB67631.1 TetR family transcriptional regulator [Nitrospirillum amazonense]